MHTLVAAHIIATSLTSTSIPFHDETKLRTPDFDSLVSQNGRATTSDYKESWENTVISFREEREKFCLWLKVGYVWVKWVSKYVLKVLDG